MQNKKFDLQPHPNFKIICHRGVSGLAPENTLTSFALASKLGLNWIELDIRRAATGEWIVIHDHTLERTTNGTGLVGNTAYDSLKKLDAGSWFNARYQSERIPSLKEVFENLLIWNVHPNIEIKSMNGDPHSLMQDFANFLDLHWPKTNPSPLISSFDLDLLQALRHYKPDLPIGYIIEKFSDSALETVIQQGFQTLHCNYRYIQARHILKAKAQNVLILVYTVNTPELYQTLLEQGVTAVFSDNPDLLLQN